MTKFFLICCIGLFLSLLETSFFSSLHGFLKFTPFVLVMSVYLRQHHTILTAPWWMVVHGVWLDWSGMSATPFITIAFIVAAWVISWCAQHLFSNRSLYGVLGCAVLSFASFTTVSFVLRLLSSAIQKNQFFKGVFFQDAGWQLLGMFFLIVVLFSFGKQIRSILQNMLLIPKSRQTF